MPRVQIEVARHERAKEIEPLIIEANGQEFTCQTELSGFVLMELAAAGAENAKPMDSSAAFINFFKDVFEPESYQRFRDMVVELKLTADDMLPFVEKAVEYISARPTTPPSSSPTGAGPTLTPSKEASSSEDTAAASDGSTDDGPQAT